ncbi:subtilisin-like ookinete protein SOPT [Plasmodium brasilianum]|uniref:subtilisin n=2 Tax=Plasmodium (Plasmodium) TaxID=418103 RepID=A0A1A8WQJ4_PLAMA|nr:conserved Plasmodium protein, unknown function [Plasmodium malariae]KAI4839746.1 subtilisin-like ookinete protein SOPT [Plasmodium brasilianum]SBS95168.1 hypothetical protein PMALA_046260 [Plasmodium malariae]SBT86689.1 conserved Plasmodium protein, unknown function [Plasmodium malariae]
MPLLNQKLVYAVVVILFYNLVAFLLLNEAFHFTYKIYAQQHVNQSVRNEYLGDTLSNKLYNYSGRSLSIPRFVQIKFKNNEDRKDKEKKNEEYLSEDYPIERCEYENGSKQGDENIFSKFYRSIKSFFGITSSSKKRCMHYEYLKHFNENISYMMENHVSIESTSVCLVGTGIDINDSLIKHFLKKRSSSGISKNDGNSINRYSDNNGYEFSYAKFNSAEKEDTPYYGINTEKCNTKNYSNCESTDLEDINNHGSYIANTIIQADLLKKKGVFKKNVDIVICKAFGEKGKNNSPLVPLIKCLEYCKMRRVKIIHISYNIYDVNDKLMEIMEELKELQIIVVVPSQQVYSKSKKQREGENHPDEHTMGYLFPSSLSDKFENVFSIGSLLHYWEGRSSSVSSNLLGMMKLLNRGNERESYYTEKNTTLFNFFYKKESIMGKGSRNMSDEYNYASSSFVNTLVTMLNINPRLTMKRIKNILKNSILKKKKLKGLCKWGGVLNLVKVFSYSLKERKKIYKLFYQELDNKKDEKKTAHNDQENFPQNRISSGEKRNNDEHYHLKRDYDKDDDYENPSTYNNDVIYDSPTIDNKGIIFVDYAKKEDPTTHEEEQKDQLKGEYYSDNELLIRNDKNSIVRNYSEHSGESSVNKGYQVRGDIQNQYYIPYLNKMKHKFRDEQVELTNVPSSSSRIISDMRGRKCKGDAACNMNEDISNSTNVSYPLDNAERGENMSSETHSNHFNVSFMQLPSYNEDELPRYNDHLQGSNHPTQRRMPTGNSVKRFKQKKHIYNTAEEEEQQQQELQLQQQLQQQQQQQQQQLQQPLLQLQQDDSLFSPPSTISPVHNLDYYENKEKGNSFYKNEMDEDTTDYDVSNDWEKNYKSRGGKNFTHFSLPSKQISKNFLEKDLIKVKEYDKPNSKIYHTNRFEQSTDNSLLYHDDVDDVYTSTAPYDMHIGEQLDKIRRRRRSLLIGEGIDNTSRDLYGFPPNGEGKKREGKKRRMDKRHRSKVQKNNLQKMGNRKNGKMKRMEGNLQKGKGKSARRSKISRYRERGKSGIRDRRGRGEQELSQRSKRWRRPSNRTIVNSRLGRRIRKESKYIPDDNIKIRYNTVNENIYKREKSSERYFPKPKQTMTPRRR